ncbi:hypothetical protein [Streptococcus suis]|uniref:hypothetical protein n=1 Tax=Streptococcus suis TaxID=1307 RepID=UPI00209C5587|nr:hypothetical protein [Streptococcus suis]MCO8220979.1 hypothetical protein [Streptococcus suis]HEM3512290.1 hypothetical protein [Streptococcus suis]HEM3527155.1 hypothetical protein [Streptococcus suis]HEM6535061.1 hypothetical protein [Streptococcus suis]
MISIQYALNQYLAQQVREQSFAGYVQQELYSAIPSGIFLVEDIVHGLVSACGPCNATCRLKIPALNRNCKPFKKTMTFSYLKMKLPAEEISSLIGYSEVNAFSRATKTG